MRSLVLTLAAVLATSCARRDVVLDLVAAAPVADHEASFDLIRVGTPAAEPRTSTGIYVEPPQPGDSFGWARRHTGFRFQWKEAKPRTLVLDVAPYPGVQGQAVDVLLNKVVVARVDLEPQRRRYRVSLPAEIQTAGDNILHLDFTRVAPEGNPHGRRLAAALYGVVVDTEPSPLLESVASRDAPPPVSIDEAGRTLTLLGPGSMSFAFELPDRPELRFRPRTHPMSARLGLALNMRVTMQRDGSAEEELWRGTGAEGREVGVRLPGDRGEIVRLRLQVDGPASGFGWGVWGAPRIVGTRSRPAPGPRLDALRASLQRANVLLVVLDAASARHFSGYGYGRKTTPEIDRLAAEGVVFRRAYTPAVFTLGAMSSLWTSLFPDQHHQDVGTDAPLPSHHLTLAELLTANGVATAGFVANGFAGSAFGLDRGFQHFEEVYREHGHRAGAFLEAMPPWLDKNRERRFFAYAHFREPHFPYDPQPPFDTLFGPDAPLDLAQRSAKDWYASVNEQRTNPSPAEIEHLVRLYDGNLAYADHVFGELRREMERLGLWDRTVVIVTADHGEALYEHGYVGHNHQLYEESTWIPLVVRFPGRAVRPGATVEAPVGLTDLAPTVADIFGLLDKEPARSFRGRSLLPLAFGAEGGGFAVSRVTGDQPRYGLRDPRFRYTFDSRYGVERLYDLAADPFEKTDLSATRPVLTAYQRQRLYRWLLQTRATPHAPPSGETSAEPDKETIENLRALGYVN